MALKKVINYKGIEADYLCITTKEYQKWLNKTIVTLSLFVNKDSRNEGLDNALQTFVFNFDGDDLSKKECYDLIKASKLEKQIIEPEKTIIKIDAYIDEEGNKHEPEYITIKEVSEMIETNIFASATDC